MKRLLNCWRLHTRWDGDTGIEFYRTRNGNVVVTRILTRVV